MRGVKISVLMWALMSGVAFAQDADGYEPPTSYADAVQEEQTGESYDWSGSYLGLTAAYAIGSHDTLGIGGIDSGAQDLSGYSLGGHLGQNYQLTRIVLGTEADFSKSEITGSFNLPGSAIACNMPGFKCTTNVDWYGSFRGRAGVSLGDVLPYVTAGIAVAGVSSDFTGPGFDTKVGGLGFGWVAGAGVEYSLMKNLIIRGEALHFDLDDVTDTVLGTKVKLDTSYTVVRTGLSLKF
jgi:outer membrane immunogenic protein